MRLAASVFLLTVLVLQAGCSDDDSTSPRLAAYHLEKAWPESEPATDRGDLTIPAGAKIVRCGPPALACPGALEIPRRTLYYTFTGKPSLTTHDFDADSVRETVRRDTGPIVFVRLTKQGRSRFRAVTRRIAAAGRRDRRVHHLALVVDDRLVAFPTIDYEVAPRGLDTDAFEISALTRTEAKNLANALRGD